MVRREGMIIHRPTQGPRPAFADRSWQDPKVDGPLGPMRWCGWRPETIAARGGIERDGAQCVSPAAISTTVPAATCEELADRFRNAVVAGRTGKIYPRLGTETSFKLECDLAGMHNCGDAMVFANGMAAISHFFLTILAPGDNIVAHKTMYGCSFDLTTKILTQLGVEVRLVDLTDPRILRSVIDSNTRAVYFETPANPTLALIDIAAVVGETKGRCPIVVDNTFQSVLGQNPFEQGANIVVYSLTKSMCGHANAMGGAVLGSGAFLEHLFVTRKDIGGSLAPEEAHAIMAGMKTLPERIEKMQENARVIARMLREHPEVERVYYPEFDARYPLNGQMKGPGHVMAMVLKKGFEGGRTFINSLSMIVNAVSLGGIVSLASHSASTTHACVPQEAKLEAGILEGAVRLSVGKEHVDDIRMDIEHALRSVAAL